MIVAILAQADTAQLCDHWLGYLWSAARAKSFLWLFVISVFCDVRVIRLAASDSHAMESPGSIPQIVQRLQQIGVRDDLSSWMSKSCPDAGKGMLRLDADLAIAARLILFRDENVVLKHKTFKAQRTTLSPDGKVYCDAGNAIYQIMMDKCLYDTWHLDDYQYFQTLNSTSAGNVLEQCLYNWRHPQANHDAEKLDLMERLAEAILLERWPVSEQEQPEQEQDKKESGLQPEQEHEESVDSVRSDE